MGKIYYLFGKSASGKDSIYHELCADKELGLAPVVLYTTRPRRRGEEEGVQYHFITDARLKEFVEAGKVIEMRTYETVHGLWSYATIDDGGWNLSERDYLAVGVLESYLSMRAYFGEENVIPVYIEVEDGERLGRALARERMQPAPRYEEMCRRFLADQADFAPNKLRAAGIDRVFRNDSLVGCVAEIRKVIAQTRQKKAT